MERFAKEIDGWQLANLSQDAKGELRGLLTRHSVLIFRGQSLARTELCDIGRIFGPAMRPIPLTVPPSWILEALSDENRGYSAMVGAAFLVKGGNGWCVLAKDVSIKLNGAPQAQIPSIILGDSAGVVEDVSQLEIIDTLGAQQVGATDVWHSDWSFVERPPAVGMLYSEIVPDPGIGDTMFCDMISTLDALSPNFRNVLSQCRAVHAVDAHLSRLGDHRGRMLKIPAIPQAVSHPVIRSLRDRKTECLFVNPFYTREIEGMHPEESDALLNLLFDAATRPEFSYRHRWHPGDVVIWDNRSTMHYAVRDVRSAAHRRLLRVLSEGEIPLPAKTI